MTKLKKMRVRHFQKHKDLILNLDRRVTVIVGANGRGKSGLVRALAAVMLNKVRPAHVSHGKDWCRVDLQVGKSVVSRIKGKNCNKYILDQKNFAAFGGKVPDQVERLLNVGEENFQRQDDARFWFSDTAGIVSKKLNRIVNLDAIDTSLAFISKEVTAAKADLEASTIRLKEAKERRDKAEIAVKLDLMLKRVEEADYAATRIARKRSQLRFLLQGVSDCRREVGSLSDAILAGEKAVILAGRAEELTEKHVRLKKIIAEVKECLDGFDELPDPKEADAAVKEADAATERWRRLVGLMSEIRMAEELWQEWDQKVKNVVRRIKLGPACPTCGKPLNPSSSSSGTSTCEKRHRSPGRKKATNG